MFNKTIFISILFLAVSKVSTLHAEDKINITASSNAKKINQVNTKTDTPIAKADNQDKISENVSDTRYTVSPLMLSEKENLNLQNALTSLINKVKYINDELEFTEDGIIEDEEEEQSERSYIYLASLLYFGKENWVIWINDKKITSDDNDMTNEFYVKNITKKSVNIVWKLGITKWKIITGKSDDQIPEINENNQIVNNFKLEPNQTYILADNSITEGKIKLKPTESKISKEQIKEDKSINSDSEFSFF